MLRLTYQYLATWCKELTHWKSPWCCERLRAEEGKTEDEIAEWHPQLNGHEFKQTLEDSEGQGILACCSLWCHSQMQLSNWTTTRARIGLPWLFSGKDFACLYRLCPWVGEISWRRKWQLPPVFCLGNPMNRGVRWAMVLGAAKVWTTATITWTKNF